MTREEAVAELREICTMIGCSGMDYDLCFNNPQDCKIIRKIMRAGKGDNDGEAHKGMVGST